MHTTLNSGSEYADFFHLLGGQILGDDCPCSGGSDIGQIGFIQQDAEEVSGLLTEYQHQSFIIRQIQLIVLIKARGDLDDIIISPDDASVFDMQISWRILEKEFSNRGDNGFTLGISDKSLFDGLDQIQVLENVLYLFYIINFDHENSPFIESFLRFRG